MKISQVIKRTFWAQSVQYKGQTQRKEFWISLIFALLCVAAAIFLAYLPNFMFLSAGDFDDMKAFHLINLSSYIVSGSVILYLGICILFALARRLRDAGLPAWLAGLYPVLVFVPVVQTYVFVIFAILSMLPSKQQKSDRLGVVRQTT